MKSILDMTALQLAHALGACEQAESRCDRYGQRKLKGVWSMISEKDAEFMLGSLRDNDIPTPNISTEGSYKCNNSDCDLCFKNIIELGKASWPVVEKLLLKFEKILNQKRAEKLKILNKFQLVLTKMANDIDNVSDVDSLENLREEVSNLMIK